MKFKNGDRIELIAEKPNQPVCAPFIFDEKYVDKAGYIDVIGWGKVHINNFTLSENQVKESVKRLNKRT